MPREDIAENSPLGISTLFRGLGGLGNVSGPGIFMLRTMAIGSTARVLRSAVGGLTTAIIGAAVFGTGGLPFIVGATLAFGGGIALYYRSCLNQALLALENYPHLMLLHLDGNYPTQRWDMTRARALLDGKDNGWIGKSMLVTSWQSAGPALDEVQAQKENVIVAGIVERTTREYGAESQESV